MIEMIKNLLKLNKKKPEKDVYEKINDLFDSLGTDEITIQLGEDLVCYGGKIAEQVGELRNKIKDNTGLIIPPVRVMDNLDFQENEFRIKIRNEFVYTGFTVPKEDYAINEITRCLEDACMNNLDKVLTNEMVEKYIEVVQRNNGWLVWYLSRLIPTTGIKVILVDLIKNNKSINDITYIFEKICEQATKSRDMYTIPDVYKIAEKIKLELK